MTVAPTAAAAFGGLQPDPATITPPGQPPHPDLSAVGFQGAIADFNQKVDSYTQQHQAMYGYQPSPTRVLAAVVQAGPQGSPAPPEPAAVQAAHAAIQTAVARSPESFLIVNHNGVLQQNTPMAQIIANQINTAPIGPFAATRDQYLKLSAKYPWVPAGMPPGPNPDKVNAAMAWQAKTNPTDPALADFQQMLRARGDATSSDLAATDPTALYNKSLAQNMDRSAVKTITQAQQNLAQSLPEFFGHLPVTGTMNQDWNHAMGRYMGSEQYFQDRTNYIARQSGFTNPYVFAQTWRKRDALVAANPHIRNLISSIPLAAFAQDPEPLKRFLLGDTSTTGGILTAPFHLLTTGVKTAFGELGGTLQDLKNNTAFAAAYLQQIMPYAIGIAGDKVGVHGLGTGVTKDEARAQAKKVLLQNDNWLQAFTGGQSDQFPGWARTVGALYSTALDFYWGNKITLQGRGTIPGDVTSALTNRPVLASDRLAFNAAAKGDIGLAASTLKGGEKLLTAVEPMIQSGQLTYPEFHRAVAELMTYGRTVLPAVADAVPVVISEDPLLTHLMSSSTVFKPMTGVGPTVHQVARQAGDWADSSIARIPWAGNAAQNFVSVIRNSVARAAPSLENRSRFYSAKAADDLFNWTNKNFRDRELATQWRNEFVRARGSDNTQAMDDLQQKITAAFNDRFPLDMKGRPRPPVVSTGPELESEAQSSFFFPGGGLKSASSPWDRIENRAARVNADLNKLGTFHRQVIVSGMPVPGGGESLFFKHALADTARRIAAGGGVRFDLSAAEQATKAWSDNYLQTRPDLIRMLGSDRAAAKNGFDRYLSKGPVQHDPASFNTSDFVSQQTGETLNPKVALAVAGGWLRRQVTDKSLTAYRASSQDDLTPLQEFVKNDSFQRAQMTKIDGYAEDMERAQADEKAGMTPLFGRSPVNQVIQKYGELQAQKLWNNFREIEHEAQSKGVADPFTSILNVITKNLGDKSDPALGDWIKANNLNLNVREGLVPVGGGPLDNYMHWWVGKLLTFNKLNRQAMFDHAFYGALNDFREAGWDPADAHATASLLAKGQTEYHMLDFTNMLQVEQDMRWMSYFATKHRLYWTWIAKYFAHHPVAAAAVDDVKRQLDPKGNLNFTLFGHRVSFPAARMFWVTGTDYSQVSPPVAFAAAAIPNLATQGPQAALDAGLGSVSGTSGNVFTRDDQALVLMSKAALMQAGAIPATYSLATLGLGDAQKKDLQRRINEYNAAYKLEHGVFPTDQASVVKHVLVGTALGEFQRANMFIAPIVPATGDDPDTVKLLNEYGKLTDPAAKHDFLSAHPEVALHFGITQDPNLYYHNKLIGEKYTALKDAHDAANTRIFADALKNGYTVKDEAAYKAESKRFQAGFQALQELDRLTWTGSNDFPANAPVGPWSKAFAGDPTLGNAYLHQQFPLIPAEQFAQHTINDNVTALQGEINHYRKVGWQAASFPSEKKMNERISQIEQTIAVFNSFPKTPLTELRTHYYNGPYSAYVNERQRMQDSIFGNAEKGRKAMPSDQRSLALQEFRAWRDKQDHPVQMVQDGKTIQMPSPVKLYYALLTGDERRKQEATIAGYAWADTAGYEKDFVGRPTAPEISDGWAQLDGITKKIQVDHPGASVSADVKAAIAAIIDKGSAADGIKPHPGFLKDYQFSLKPKIDRFKTLNVYESMPADARKQFDALIGDDASAISKTLSDPNVTGDKAAVKQLWRNYVAALQGNARYAGQFTSDKNFGALSRPEYKALEHELSFYSPDFLNTLVAP